MAKLVNPEHIYQDLMSWVLRWHLECQRTVEPDLTDAAARARWAEGADKELANLRKTYG